MCLPYHLLLLSDPIDPRTRMLVLRSDHPPHRSPWDHGLRIRTIELIGTLAVGGLSGHLGRHGLVCVPYGPWVYHWANLIRGLARGLPPRSSHPVDPDSSRERVAIVVHTEDQSKSSMAGSRYRRTTVRQVATIAGDPVLRNTDCVNCTVGPTQD